MPWKHAGRETGGATVWGKASRQFYDLNFHLELEARATHPNATSSALLHFSYDV